METIEIKTKAHKSGLRVWIEGDRVKGAGFKYHRKYSTSYLDGSIILELDSDGKRKVSGRKRAGDSEWCPIIDLCGAKVSASLGDAERVSVTYNANAGRITIKPL